MGCYPGNGCACQSEPLEVIHPLVALVKEQRVKAANAYWDSLKAGPSEDIREAARYLEAAIKLGGAVDDIKEWL